MKLYLVSDLHLEFAAFTPPVPTVAAADVVVLAGDIHVGVAGLAWARQAFGSKPIVYVAGNHEFYGHHWTRLVEDLRRQAALLGIYFLENSTVDLSGMRFIGCTLWTDFDFHQDVPQSVSMARVERGLNDFALIEATDPEDENDGAQGPGPSEGLSFTRSPGKGPLLQARHTLIRHMESRRWLSTELENARDLKVVVVSHHGPSVRSVAERYRDDRLTPGFVSHLDRLVTECDLWVHGHTHDSFDYEMARTDGRSARVVCNPRGYPLGSGGFENPCFQPGLLIDL